MLLAEAKNKTFILGASLYLIAMVCLVWDELLFFSKFYIEGQLILFVAWSFLVFSFIVSARRNKKKYWWFIFSVPLMKGPFEVIALFVVFSFFGYNAP